VTDLQWVVGAYALTFASIMLACGMIGDELGRKKVMVTGGGLFCAGSVLCALAPDVQVLIAGRAVMGLDAAASEPGTLSMLRHLFPDARVRGRAIGVWAATSGFALAAGPVVGGVLVGTWSWRGIFWFNLAFGLAALIVAAIILPESADPAAARVDTAGALLGAGALASLVFAIIDSESAGFGSAEVIVLLCLSAVLFAGSAGGSAGRRIRCWTFGSSECRSSRPRTSPRSAPTSPPLPSSSLPRCTWPRWPGRPATGWR
jgi:MFS family permease